MKVGIFAWGSAGDIRPLIALGAGLRSAGHEVTMYIRSMYEWRAVCDQHGLEYQGSLFTGYNDIASEHNEALWTERYFRELFLAHQDKTYLAAEKIASDCDILISHYFMSYPVKAAAANASKPYITVTLSPFFVESRYTPPANRPNLGPHLNPLLWKHTRDLGITHLKQEIARFWHRKGLPEFDNVLRTFQSDVLNFLPVSRALVAQQLDWGNHHIVTGFMDLPTTPAVEDIEQTVVDFLDAGEPPVLMTFGTAQGAYPGGDPEVDSRLLLEAANAGAFRALVQVSTESEGTHLRLRGLVSSPNALAVGWLPYSAVLPRCAVVVHAGGMGVTHMVTKYGRPSIVVPFIDEHMYWGKKLCQLGVAPKPVRRNVMNARSLTSMVAGVLDQPEFERRSIKLGETLRAEDGVRRAVQIINERWNHM